MPYRVTGSVVFKRNSTSVIDFTTNNRPTEWYAVAKTTITPNTACNVASQNVLLENNDFIFMPFGLLNNNIRG